MISWMIGQTASPEQFDLTTLGQAAIFLLIAGYMAKRYFDREAKYDARFEAMMTKHAEDYQALVSKHADSFGALVKEGNETLKGLAVVLDRVQVGMAQQVERAVREGPTPDQMLKAFERLEQTTENLNQQLKRRGD
jgi:hypothetical protein